MLHTAFRAAPPAKVFSERALPIPGASIRFLGFAAAILPRSSERCHDLLYEDGLKAARHAGARRCLDPLRCRQRRGLQEAGLKRRRRGNPTSVI
jgi:hypothetical protein